ncbi:hypothetical protein [Aurantimonas sp. 22II-16-19i]|uniref:hypothetical protein n=1 Tax=Aurantimonas sp. 22II-16-19i TaxID=1317114 RepID=UPI0009F7EFCC|nr:hypothetical protein [Aurantimonas sp. 22II-16-19i]ORE92722.1 hypothetical protein ATO4_16885 [Aurantimonas sp. 22II-16-19i]
MNPAAGRDRAAVLAAMREAPSLPEGWDVALNLSASSVRSLLASRSSGAQARDADDALVFIGPGETDGRRGLVALRADLPSPSLVLSQSDQAARLLFRIEAGTLQPGRLPGETPPAIPDARALLEGVGTRWSDPLVITDDSPLHLTVLAPLAVRREPEGGFTVELDLTAAGVTLADARGADISGELICGDTGEWLAAGGFSGHIASLASPQGYPPHALAPGQVAARIAASLEGEPLLQILTGPASAPQLAAASAPVPHPDGDGFSVIVGSEAAMALVASSYNLGTGDIKLSCVPPQDGQVHWFLQVHEPMVFEGRFGNTDGQIYVTDHARFYMRFGGSCDEGLQLFTFTDPASTVRLELELSAHYPVAISGEGTGQLVGLEEGAQAVTGEGFYENIVKPQLQTFLLGDIRADMTRVRLTAVSDLVLRDLALPGHALTFEVAALPGDLLIAGSLAPTP